MRHRLLRMPFAALHRLYIWLLIVLPACQGDISHSFTGAWQALPAELQGEVQGMPAHWAVQGRGGAVSSANALATEAGIEILRKGGNAIDALLAVQWVLAVVEPQSSGLGGGGFLLYYEARTKKVYALDGRETAPANIDQKIFLDAAGKPLPFKERIAGARAVGVPGTVALLEYAKNNLGTQKISFADTFGRAIHIARDGVRVSPRLAQAMSLNRDRLIRQNADSGGYLKNGQPYAIGEVLYQSDLAGTLKILAESGAEAFYRGTIARDIIATVTRNRDYASKMNLDDLVRYNVRERRPAELALNGTQVYSVAAPASGEYVLATLSATRAAGPDIDLIASSLAAQKNAFIEREKILEDPDFGPKKKSGATGVEAQNTTHVSIADGEGNIVSYTSSVETSMGSALIVRGRGFLLNNQLSDFAAEPGKVNSVQGNKRPKSSMSPLILLKPDGSYAALGSPGGPTIVGTNALVASRYLAGTGLQQAILQPRALVVPNGKVLVELELRRDKGHIQYLKQRGFDLDLRRSIISLGSVQAVGYDVQTKFFTAASDLRREGLGLVVEPVVD